MERGVVSPPMVFLGLGIALGKLGWLDSGAGLLDGLTELTLVLVLFTDAARIDLAHLRLQESLPARLLGIGLPLTVAAGAFAAWVILPGLEPWEAVLLGAVLAPTDAALGQAVVSNPLVPVRVRQPGPQRRERPQRRHRPARRPRRRRLRGRDGRERRPRPLALLRDPAGDAGPAGGGGGRIRGWPRRGAVRTPCRASPSCAWRRSP